MGHLLDKCTHGLMPDQDKHIIVDSPFEPSHARGLFGDAVTAKQLASDLRKKQSEVLDFCLPHKVTPHQPLPAALVAMVKKWYNVGFKGSLLNT